MSEKPIKKVSLFNYKDIEINFIYRNGGLGYTFEKDGKHYGQLVKPESKATQDVASAAFLLFLNFIETLEALEKLDEPKSVRGKDKKRVK